MQKLCIDFGEIIMTTEITGKSARQAMYV